MLSNGCRFDPTTETTTRFPIDRNGPQSVLGPVIHVSQDRAGIVWLSTRTGLHRLDPASGAYRHYAHDPADPDSLSSSLVKSTYEDREGTLWVCTVAGLDAFDRRTEKVTERIRLHVAESRTRHSIRRGLQPGPIPAKTSQNRADTRARRIDCPCRCVALQRFDGCAR